MQGIIISIWILHGLIMFVDEFYYHHRRGLGRWESLGHPVDTLFFMACFIYALVVDPSHPWGFVVLAMLSTLIITKDEFVHAKQCPGGEQWLHALLFIIHPVALFGLYHVWTQGGLWLVRIQAAIILLFGLYQVIYWNVLRGKTNPA